MAYLFCSKNINYNQGEEIEYPLLIVNCKSGISYYLVKEKKGPLIKQLGSIVGESTLSAMTKLLRAANRKKSLAENQKQQKKNSIFN